jgi:hypothetical protein
MSLSWFRRRVCRSQRVRQFVRDGVSCPEIKGGGAFLGEHVLPRMRWVLERPGGNYESRLSRPSRALITFNRAFCLAL